ncbi:MAG: hypothetical protein K2H83_03880 [Duncaniella sp.]|nr:hypothetical protein [Duncaniella sp.]
MKKIWRWFLDSNRHKHFIGGLAIGACAFSDYGALYAGTLTASALEFKDKTWGGEWDWTALGITVAGAILGRLAARLAIGIL